MIIFNTTVSSQGVVDHRTIDGSNNNLTLSKSGSRNINFKRISPTQYSDGMKGIINDRPNSRDISNELFNQSEPIFDDFLNDLFWNYGQFIDHDLVLNRGNSGEILLINVPHGDTYFDPFETGSAKIPVVRGAFLNEDNVPREQINQVTAWLDGSMIYGSSEEAVNWLRSGIDGKLKTSKGNMLPFNTVSGEYDSEIDPSAPFMENPVVPQSHKIYVAGDIRANEQPGLLSLHTLFVREHNRICDGLVKKYPTWSDEEVFQVARKYVGALLQSITYYEWLPHLGVVLDEYSDYNEDVQVSIYTEFSAAAFRFGHSLVNEQFVRLDEEGQEIVYGSVNVHESFFNPDIIKDQGGIEPFLRGMMVQKQQKFDEKIIGSLRNFLFGKPGEGGLDLAVLNIVRGRERGIPDLNTVRNSLGLDSYTSFDQIGEEPVATKLSTLYNNNINNIDPWVGILSETDFNQALIGETSYYIIKKQFEELRDGDRFWFENDTYFSKQEIDSLKSVRLADIIKKNTDIERVNEDSFKAENVFITLNLEPFEEIKTFDIKLFPNPFYDKVSLKLNANSSGKACLRISSINGSLLFEKCMDFEAGENLYALDFSNNSFVSGTYILEFYSQKKKGIFTLIKK